MDLCHHAAPPFLTRAHDGRERIVYASALVSPILVSEPFLVRQEEEAVTTPVEGGPARKCRRLLRGSSGQAGR